MSSLGKRKTFRVLDPVALAQFELLCKRFKLEEQQAFDAMMKRWIRENEKTVQLDNFLTSTPTSIHIIQPQTVNIAIKAELTYCKLELSRLLHVLETTPEENRPDFLKQLTKLLFQASRVQAATQDQELTELLTKAEMHLR